MDKKLIVGAIAAGLTGAIAYLGQNLNLPAEIIAGAIAGIAWLASWVNGRNNSI